jgi:hypothetical protein
MIDGGVADLGQEGSGGQDEQEGERGQGPSFHMVTMIRSRFF